MTNPAGWLRCAIEQDYSAPPGYHAAQKAATEKEEWQTVLEEHTQQLFDLQESEEISVSRPYPRSENFYSDRDGTLLKEHPCPTLSVSKNLPPLTQAWEAGYTEVAQLMPIGNLLESNTRSNGSKCAANTSSATR